MRTLNLYQIRDLVSHTMLGEIMATYHEAAAIRSFTDILKNPKSILHSHPDDYDLIFLGYQDEESGTLDPLTTPQIILTGKAWNAAQAPLISADGNSRLGDGERPLMSTINASKGSR